MEEPIWHKFVTIACVRCGYSHRVPVMCGDRWCPVCGHIKQRRARKRLEWLVRVIRAPVGMSLKFITLTERNQKGMIPDLKGICDSFRRLRQRVWWKNRVYGGVYVIEITGSKHDWHVHLHIIAHAKYLPHKKLSEVWSKVSSGRIVWIQRVRATDVVAYVSKYLTKASVDEGERCYVSGALRSQRLFGCFGGWHKVNARAPREKPVCPQCGGQQWTALDRPTLVEVPPDLIRATSRPPPPPPKAVAGTFT